MTTTRIGWLDLQNGVAGDMLLGALVDTGVPLEVMSTAVEHLDLPIRLRAEAVKRAGLAATRVHVDTPDEAGQPARTWRTIRQMLTALPTALRASATAVFESLAHAEAQVHGMSAEQVHFHEVGALDSITDIVGACAGLAHLQLDRLVVSPIAVGGGTVRAAHGRIPVPVPAVVTLLQASEATGFGGPDAQELATPTGVAIATALAHGYGMLPPMRISATGVGAGSADPAHRPNVVRLIVGDVLDTTAAAATSAVVLEANVDDMDPRMWPAVLSALLDAGAGDAWLTPILMKKGRPAHTVSAITSRDAAARVRETLFAATTTIGLRQSTVDKFALRREYRTIEALGQPISIKLAVSPAGVVVNASAEWDDVAAVAASTATPIKQVLAVANSLAGAHVGHPIARSVSPCAAAGESSPSSAASEHGTPLGREEPGGATGDGGASQPGGRARYRPVDAAVPEPVVKDS